MDTASTSINPTGKQRDPPPLSVYVRIRPFINDELERGENQKLIDILDEKRIAVKLSSTNRTWQTSYNEYEVTRIFDHRCTQQILFEEILEQPTNEIFTGSNWLFCTLGLTNSGKTHTMFGTAEEMGLIPKCLQRIFRNVGQNIDHQVLFKPVGLENFMPTVDGNLNMEMIVRNYIFKDEKSRMRLPEIVEQQNDFADLSIEDEYYSIWISFFELYNENLLDLLVQPKDMKSRKNLRLIQNDQSTMIKNLIQIPVFDMEEAENIIQFGFANRATSKTNLNQASSRSHAVICITLITINEFDEEPTISHIYICDLAGNEPSTSSGKQLTETCNINTSLMTFKDCIRVLNENQFAKKQMRIPYRNSVLTSIFRPFFVGRGRTIICCNINPCAAFISQTNDLLKFSALAQKTVIVPNEAKTAGLIRVQRKSKNKGPKRLGKHSLSREKNLTRNDQMEASHIQSINTSAMIMSTDVKSLTYWKSCAKQAVDLLQKQASNRRIFLIERHQERVRTVHYLLDQRQLNEKLIKENQSLIKQQENLRLEQDKHLCTEQLYNELLLKENQSRQEIVKLDKEYQEEIKSVRNQLEILQEQFERLTTDHVKSLEQTDHDKHEHQEEMQRLKRDFGLELYRKQDAEKKARLFEDKLRHEQTQYQKTQYDFTKTKHELSTLQVKYDALQLEMMEIQQKTKIKPSSIVEMFVDRTSTTTIPADEEQQPIAEPQKRSGRAKRPTNDENQPEQEIKKAKRVTRSRSNASTDTMSALPQSENKSERIIRNASAANTHQNPVLSIKQTRKKAQDEKTDSKTKPKTPAVRGRTKKQLIEPSPEPVQQESHSPIYATIQRNRSIDRASFATVVVDSPTVHIAPSNETANVTPKPSTFKRIQSFFRATPTMTNSTKVNRVVQVKSTVVAFGSSTPTHRLPPSIVKTPGPTAVPTPTASVAQKIATPKSRYNLRTRLFHNPLPKDEDEKKTQTKRPVRARK